MFFRQLHHVAFDWLKSHTRFSGTNVCKKPFLRDFTFANRLLEKMGKYRA